MRTWRTLGGPWCDLMSPTLRSRIIGLCCGLKKFMVMFGFVYGRGWSAMGVAVGFGCMRESNV